MRSTHIVCGVIALVMAASSGDALAAAPPNHPATSAAIEARLDRKMDCDFTEVPFIDVVHYFRTTLDVNILYEAPGREDEERFITLQVRDMPARSALKWAIHHAGMDYVVFDSAIYIGPPDRIEMLGPVRFAQYDVTDLLIPIGALREDNDDDDDGDDDNNRSGRSADAAHELMALIVIFTGGMKNWDHVEVMGYAERVDDDTESQEDVF